MERGVLFEFILKEDKFFFIYENLLYLKKIMNKKGFKSIIIVLNMFYLRRVSLIVKKLKMNVFFLGVYVK